MAGRDGLWARFRAEVRRDPFRLGIAAWTFLAVGVFCFVAPLIGPYVGIPLSTRAWWPRLYASGAGVLIALGGYALLRFVGFWPFARFLGSRRRDGMFDRR